MADPNNAGVILTTPTTHNGAAIGVVTGYAFEETAEVVKIKGEGTFGPAAVCIIGKDLTCIVDWLVKGVVAPGTIGSLIFTLKDSAGNTITDTLSNMMALGYAKNVHRENPPFNYRQLFTVKDPMTVDPVS